MSLWIILFVKRINDTRGSWSISGETVLLAFLFLFKTASKWQGSYTLLMVCTCGQALCEQIMFPRACIQFSEKKIIKTSRSLCRSKHFLQISSSVYPTMHKLSLPDLFQGFFIMREAKSLFPRNRIQNALNVPFKKNYFVCLVYALKIIQCFKNKAGPSLCLFIQY